MKKRAKIIFVIAVLTVAVSAACVAAFGDGGDVNALLGRLTSEAKKSESKDIVAEYKDVSIGRNVLEYQKNVNAEREKSLSSDDLPDYMKYKPESDGDIINRLIVDVILVEEAERLEIAATKEETSEWVSYLKKGYDEFEETKKSIEAYCAGAGITVDEYWEDIEENAYDTYTRLKMENRFRDEYYEKHAAESGAKTEAGTEEYLAAYAEYRAGLLDKHRDEITYYID